MLGLQRNSGARAVLDVGVAMIACAALGFVVRERTEEEGREGGKGGGRSILDVGVTTKQWCQTGP